jgi:hypothetical protein
MSYVVRSRLMFFFKNMISNYQIEGENGATGDNK